MSTLSPAANGTDASPALTHAIMQPLDFRKVRLTSGFWADRFDQFVKVSLPLLHRQAVDPDHGHVLSNFRIAAGLEEGEYFGTNWQDAWGYKWIESAAAAYALTGDASLQEKMDELIEAIAAAQAPDGYIATQSLRRGGKRFLTPNHHELYVMGHLMTAAATHYRCTGKTTLLDVAKKAADFVGNIYATNPKRLAHFPVNPSMVMGAVDLYRVTGEPRYLELAQAIVDNRGKWEQSAETERTEFDTEPIRVQGYGDLNQDRVPVRESDKVVGHSVFWSYLYAGAADICMHTGEAALLASLRRLWRDLVDHKIYVTGGCCAIHKGFSFHAQESWNADPVHEAVGKPYELPNASGYNETCAQVGAFFWGWRMLQISGDAEHADLMEREMYNGFLPGVGIQGNDWFYTNPLARWRSTEMTTNDTKLRHQIGKTSKICCPTNVLRTVILMRGYLYSFSDDALWVHHYASGAIEDDRFGIEQQTNYPWEGHVRITVTRAPASAMAMQLRIPGWSETATVKVNGKPAPAQVQPGSYVRLERDWQQGDTVDIEFDMTPRLLAADGRVESSRNQAAVQRGPIVYCLESADLPEGVSLADVYLPRDVTLRPVAEPKLWDAVALEGEAVHRPSTGTGLYRPLSRSDKKIPLRLIPYFAWCNRGEVEMSVWLPLA